MSSLHGTQATFDPLSAAGDSSDGAFTTVFDSTAAAPPPAPAAADAASGAPPSEYDSFMTARSATSYMTASHGGGAASAMAAAAGAPPPPPAAAAAPAAAPSSLFRRLPDREPPPPPPQGSRQQFDSSPKPQLPQPFPPVTMDDSNPFAAAATAAAPTPYTHPPLTFGDDLGGAATAPPQTTAAFSMPLDLYDTPEAFARPAAAAAAAAAPLPPPAPPPPQAATGAGARLPPLYDFTREFSRMLPVSEDPTSPLDAADGAGAAWYDNGGDAATAAGGGAGGAAAGAGRLVSGPGSVPSAVGSAGGSAAAGGWAAAAGGLTSYAAAALLTNTVSVHSPRKLTAPSRIPGLSEPYISYRVTSRSAVSPETTVDRRFRDVVALAELFQSLHPGCFVPPRPNRNAVEGRRMQPGFIEERRVGIEKFLRRIVVHPVLGPSEATQVWLHAGTSDLRTSPEWLRLQPTAPLGLAKSTARLLFQVVGRERTVPSPVDVTRPASERGDVYRLVHERAAQMRGVLNRMQPSPMEEKLREETAALQERTEALVALSRTADQVVARSAKAGRAGGKLRAALGAEAEVEAAAAGPTPAAALRAATEGLEKVSKLYGVATDASAKHLTPLHDWLAAVPGCTAALAARERCLLTLATLEADEAEARARLAEAEARRGAAAVTSPPTAVTRKVDALRLQVSQLGVALTAARDEYERVGARNVSELAAFKAHMSRELADAVREYALVQLAAAQKAHDIWTETAGQLATLAAAAAATAAAASLSRGGGVAIGVGGGGGMYGGVYGS